MRILFENNKKENVYIGHTLSGIIPRPLYIENNIRNMHQVVFGSSGSGKTVAAITPQVIHDIKHGDMVIVIDPKGDSQFRDKVYTYCKKFNQKFHYFSLTRPDISTPYNPFLFGGPNERKDKIMEAFDWSESFYEKSSGLGLLKVMHSIGDKVMLSKVILYLKDMKDADSITKDKWNKNEDKKSNRMKNIQGLLADLETMQMSNYAPLLETEKYGIDYFYKQKGCFFISLDVESLPKTARNFGKVILSDIMSLSNFVKSNIKEEKRHPVTLVVDELRSFITPSFVTFLAMVRSSNFRLILAAQSAGGDLASLGRHTLDQIIDNTMTKIVMASPSPNSADYLSRMFGKNFGDYDSSKGGRGGREGRDNSSSGFFNGRKFLVDSHCLQRLQIGEGYYYSRKGEVLEKAFFDHYFLDCVEVESYEDSFLASDGGVGDKSFVCDENELEEMNSSNASLGISNFEDLKRSESVKDYIEFSEDHFTEVDH